MGGAFTAVANDHNAIWSNPAGIGRIRKARTRHRFHYGSFPSITLGFNSAATSLYSKSTSFSGTTEAEKDQQVSEAIAAIKSKDTVFWGFFGAQPSVFFEGGKNVVIAMSLFSKRNINYIPRADQDELGLLEDITDVGAVIGVGYTNRTNRLNFGFQLRPVSRSAFEGLSKPSALFANKTAQQANEKLANNVSTLGLDVGLMWTLADFWFPTIGVALLNAPIGCKEDYLNPYAEKRETVCGSMYSGTIKNSEAASLIDPMDLRVGLSILPRITRKLSLRFAVDMHRLGFESGKKNYGLSGLQQAEQIRAGVEVFLGNPLKLAQFSARAGYARGGANFGFSIKAAFLSIDLTTYSAFVGENNSKADLRTLIALSAEF